MSNSHLIESRISQLTKPLSESNENPNYNISVLEIIPTATEAPGF